MNKGTIFIISGPSGVGQGTIMMALLAKPELNLVWTKGYTTRNKRASDEVENKYTFLDHDKFNELVKSGEIFDWTNYDGINLYGSSKKETDTAINDGKNIIRDIDLVGVKNYQRSYPKFEIVTIFIKANLEVIKNRLVGRKQNTKEEIEARLKIAQKTLKTQKYYDFIVENIEGKPEIAVNEIAQIIREKSQPQ